MADNKEQNKQKNLPKQKGYSPPVSNNPKSFQQFSNPKAFTSGPPQSFSAFHRRLNNRRSSGK